MKNFLVLFFSVFFISAKAQVTNLPSLDNIKGVTKTVMNPKLYPLLLKVHISKNNTNTTDFKNFISHLNHFEVFTADNQTSGATLLNKTNTFVTNNVFTKVSSNTYELVNPTQKEYIIIKQSTDNSTVVYAFTTKLDYTGIKNLKLM